MNIIKAPPLRLRRGEIHVFVAKAGALSEPAALAQCRTFLSVEEGARLANFRFKRDSLVYLSAHALLRTTLSRFLNLNPADWRFSYTKHGKPSIENLDSLSFSVHFNLSHTQGLAACIVASECECGIDVEFVRSIGDINEIMSQVLSGAEIVGLAQKPDSVRLDDFFSIWTLKEAFVKGIGTGLSFPLSEVTFNIEVDPVAAHFSDKLSDVYEKWNFHLFSPTKSHRLAVAVNQSPADSVIIYHEVDLSIHQLPAREIGRYSFRS